ncbi:hypothetical protein HJD18_12650 [Thermoleophilia bacterium SCSIO 60948]|nr:hypothetical protein HJD18_12650 [Thermoleophilia bacterium SCSIO 60948]
MSGVAQAIPEPNGGLPLPLEGSAARVLAAVHDACGSVTAIRLPAVLSGTAIRRVSCSGCSEAYACGPLVDLGIETAVDAPAPRRHARRSLPTLPSLPSLPSLPRRRRSSGSASPMSPRERLLRVAAIPLAGVAVLAILIAIRGGDDAIPEPSARASASSQANADATAKALEKAGKDASMVSGASFSLALPPGWKQTDPSSGASFAAVAPDKAADATLWIERDPNLSFADFEQRSLGQLEQLAGSASVVERVSGPSEEASSVRLAADAPEGTPAYEVLLRVSGPYRYYLSTTLDPDASPKDAEALELIAGSLVPTAAGEG